MNKTVMNTIMEQWGLIDIWGLTNPKEREYTSTPAKLIHE